jgi:hypothetical protein
VTATPLTLTIVWHPSFAGGTVAAETIAEWFEPLNAGNLITGLRIPVRVRCVPESGRPGEAPLAISLDDADVNLVLLLGTAELIQTAAGPWQGFFQGLVDGTAQRGLRDTLMIAAFDDKSLELPANIRFPEAMEGLQALRTYQWPDKIVSLDDGKWHAGPGLVRLAIMAADNIAYRLLLLEEKEKNPDTEDGDLRAPSQTLFLSHTKHDPHGLALAENIFSLIQNNPYQLKIFLDAQDLRSGQNFWNQLTHAIADASFLAIATDRYAGRPVCQFEILEAKRLRRPVFVAYLVEKGEDRSFPYSGNVPVRILPKEPSRAEIDLLLLDCCLEYLRSLSFRREARELKDKLTQGGASVDVLSRKPELSDMARWNTMKTRPTVVLYPDPPLANHELKLMSSLAGGIVFKALSEG